MKIGKLFGVSLISFAILAGCSSTNNNTAEVNKLKTTVSSLKEENKKLSTKASQLDEILDAFGTSDSSKSDENSTGSSNTLKFNESGTFGSGEKITVISAEDAPNHQLHEPKDGEHPVEVKAVVENTTSSPISFNVQNFAMYDNNSELADFDASTYQNNIPNDIAAEMKANITFYFSSKGSGPYVVTFGDGMWKQ